jgi:1-acyl-sn-glycerol-3-phosphate acyltransferase
VRLHYRLTLYVALALARVLWGYGRSGADEIPLDGPVIIACNHLSNWDPILVGLACPREVHFMAKEELFRNRTLGWLIRIYNALPVRRGVMDRRALREASQVLRNGEVLVMFPGGTRDSSGEVRDPKAGVGFIASRNEAPVVPAHITGTNRLSEAFLRRSRVRVAFGRAMTIAGTATGDEYREFSRRVADAIGGLRREVGSG